MVYGEQPFPIDSVPTGVSDGGRRPTKIQKGSQDPVFMTLSIYTQKTGLFLNFGFNSEISLLHLCPKWIPA